MAIASTSLLTSEKTIEQGLTEAMKSWHLDIRVTVGVHRSPTLFYEQHLMVFRFVTSIDEETADLPFDTRVIGAYKILETALPQIYRSHVFSVRGPGDENVETLPFTTANMKKVATRATNVIVENSRLIIVANHMVV